MAQIQVGQLVWVKATVFDDKSQPLNERWSATNNLPKGSKTLLLGKVTAEANQNEWTIYFFCDKTSMECRKWQVHAITARFETVENKWVRKLTNAQANNLPSSSSSSSPEDSESEIDDAPINDGDIFAPQWTFERIEHDPRSNRYQFANAKLRDEPDHINDAIIESSLIWQLWTRFFPMSWSNEHTIFYTNQNASADPKWSKDLTRGEFLIFLGIICFLLVFPPAGERRNHWTDRKNGPFPFANLGRFMSRHRFELICKYLVVDDNGDPTDKLRYYRGWVEAVRLAQFHAVRPGRMIVVDETMLKNCNADNADCLTYIPRKPQPLGHQLWTVVDCESGCLVNYELNEGKEVTRERKWFAEYGATTATTLRVTQPFHRSWRVIFIDSWFQSIKTAIMLFTFGLYSCGIVKTNHKNYPRNELEEQCPQVGGGLSAAHASIESDAGPFTLLAGQWRSTSHHKVTFLATCFSFAMAANKFIFTKSRREVDQPVMAEQWYKNYGKVDAFNHTMVGDGDQGWDSALELKDRRNFPLFTGLLSLIDANMFIAMKHFYDYKGTHVDFRRELTNVLLFNPLRIDADDVSFEGPNERHNDHKQMYSNRKGRCVICSRLRNERSETKLYCSICGPESKLCRDSPLRTCWSDHIRYGIPQRTRNGLNADNE